MTPPTRPRIATSARVTKKTKKETKKATEIRLPGFSIMTKDGIDVTSTAGRGTKTKEQREHAHLMRIMKACDDCKRKKIRCDPSHRRASDTMTRTSTSTSATSSSRPNPSPPSVPRVCHQSILNSHDSFASQDSFPPPSYGTSAIEDFVLFPEDTNSYWNPADMSFDSHGLDFDFDINDVGLDVYSASNPDQFWDFSAHDQPSGFQQGHNPVTTDQYGLGAYSHHHHFLLLNVSQIVTHSNLSEQALTLIDQWASSFGGQQSPEHTRPHPSSNTQDSGQPIESLPSASSFNASPYGSTDHLLQGGSSSTSPTSFTDQLTPGSSSHSSTSLTSVSSGSSPQLLTSANGASLLTHANQDLSDAGFIDSPLQGYGQTLSPANSYFSDLENTYAEAQESLHTLQSSPARHQSLHSELLRFRESIDAVKTSPVDFSTALVTADIMSQLHKLSSQLQVIAAEAHSLESFGSVTRQGFNGDKQSLSREAYIRQCQATARRLIRSLCATICSLQTPGSTSSLSPASNTTLLASGRTAQPQSLLDRNDRDSRTVGTQASSNTDANYEVSDRQSRTIHSSYARYGADSRHCVVLREDEIADMISQADASTGAYANGALYDGCNIGVVPTSGALLRYKLVLQQYFPGPSTQESLSLFSGYPVNEQQHRLQLTCLGNFSTAGGNTAALDEAIEAHPPMVVTPTLPRRGLQRSTVPSTQVTLTGTDDSFTSTAVSSRGAIPCPVTQQQLPDASDDTSITYTASLDVKYSILVTTVLGISMLVLKVYDLPSLPSLVSWTLN